MLKLKKYIISLGKYNNNDYNNKKTYKYKHDQKIEILCRIEYYDNYNKTISDLKEYISQLSGNKICPCVLKICNNRYKEYYDYLYRDDINFCKYEDTTLLSNTELKDKFYIIALINDKCTCSNLYKEYLKISKNEIAKTINMYYVKGYNLENEFRDKNEKNEKIKNLEKKIYQYEKENKNYEIQIKQYERDKEKITSMNNEIKEKETKINNLEDEKKETEDRLKTLLNDNEKKIKENNEYQNQLKQTNRIIKDLNKQISDIKYQSNEKDNTINIIKNENKLNIEKLKSLNNQLIEKNETIQLLNNEKNKYINTINQLQENINKLKKTNENQKKEIAELNDKVRNENENKEKIKKITKDRNYYKKCLEDITSEKNKLEKDYHQKEKNEKNLNEKLKKIDENNIKEREELNKKIESLNDENSVLTMAINKDLGTLEEIHKLGYLKDKNFNDNNDNMIKIDPNSNQFIQNGKKEENKKNKEINEDIKLENFYDVVINIKSVKDISKGWEIKMSKKGAENFEKYKTKELIKIGVIGNSNKGKSFILSRISKISLPSGTSIKTEGLSIKYPDLKKFKNRKIVLLDSAGLETPVLNEKNIDDDEDDDEKEKEKNDMELINNLKNNENINKNKENEVKSNVNDNENENANKENNKENNKGTKNNEVDEKPKIFKEKSREKIITELFLQNYIIQYSDILILVVGILTYSEQKLLNRIKTDILKLKINRPLYIIHNLKTFYTIRQVKDYIKNTLRKSATFDLKKGQNISTDLKDINGTYFYERNSNPKIFHLIFANEGSEAGNYYNNFTLQFIEKKYQDSTDLKPFDVVKTIKERFIVHSTEIIEKNNENQIRLDDIITDEEILKNKIIKLKTPQKIILKRCLIDELGFSNLKGNGFEPNFNYYKKEVENENGKEKKIVVRVEAPGNSKIESKIEYSGEYTIIRLTGTKRPDKEPKNNNDNLHSTREFGEFNLDIPLKTEDYNIKSKDPKIFDKNGIIVLEYECEEKSQKFVYDVKEEDEI